MRLAHVATFLTVLFGASLAVAYNHPADCVCSNGPDVYTAGAPSTSTTGPGATATTSGGAGTPDAHGSCANYTTPSPSSATASASRKDTDNHFLSGVGIWLINYDVTDDFHQQLSGLANSAPSDSGWALARGWIKDIPNGLSLDRLISATFPSGGSANISRNIVATLPGLSVQLNFGDGSSQPIETETMSVGGATSTDQANAAGTSQSSVSQPLKVIVNSVSDIG